MMKGVEEILGGEFGLYYAIVDSSYRMSFSDNPICRYLGAGEMTGEVELVDLFPEVVGLEDDIGKIFSGESERFTINTITRYPEKDISFNLHFFNYRAHGNGCLLVVEDVTQASVSLRDMQQKRNELLVKNQELVQKEDFIRTLLNTIPNPIYYKDMEGRYIGCNRAFEEFVGRHGALIVGMNAAEIWGSEMSALFNAMDGSLLEKRGIQTYEATIPGARGIKRHVIINKALFPGEDGAPGGIVSVISDITDRRAMEEKMKELVTAVEKSPATIVITDVAGTIQYVNPKFVELTGYSAVEAVGQNPRVLKSGHHQEEFYKAMWDTILDGREWYGEILNRKKNGDLYWELASISPIRGDDGRITNFVGVKEDITELKGALDTLARSERELQARNDVMERNLVLARKTLSAIMQEKMPSPPGLDIQCRYLPLDGIGGDYYNVASDGGKTSVFICDISGHGITAALFLLLVKYFADRLKADYGGSPGKYLEMLNRELFAYIHSYFITGQYGIFSFGRKKIFSFASGGHPSPVLLKRDSAASYVAQPGKAIGIDDKARYRQRQVELEAGDMLFFYTDGIPETRNQEGTWIGFEEKLLAMFSRSRKTSLAETMDAVIGEVDRYRKAGDINDDILLLGFEVL